MDCPRAPPPETSQLSMDIMDSPTAPRATSLPPSSGDPTRSSNAHTSSSNASTSSLSNGSCFNESFSYSIICTSGCRGTTESRSLSSSLISTPTGGPCAHAESCCSSSCFGNKISIDGNSLYSSPDTTTATTATTPAGTSATPPDTTSATKQATMPATTTITTPATTPDTSTVTVTMKGTTKYITQATKWGTAQDTRQVTMLATRSPTTRPLTSSTRVLPVSTDAHRAAAACVSAKTPAAQPPSESQLRFKKQCFVVYFKFDVNLTWSALYNLCLTWWPDTPKRSQIQRHYLNSNQKIPQVDKHGHLFPNPISPPYSTYKNVRYSSRSATPADEPGVKFRDLFPEQLVDPGNRWVLEKDRSNPAIIGLAVRRRAEREASILERLVRHKRKQQDGEFLSLM